MYGAECTENNMVASGECLDVKLCSARPLAPVKGAQGAFPYFDIGHGNYSSYLNQIWYEASQ